MFDLIGDLVFLEVEILFGEFSFEIFCFTGDDLSFFMGDDFYKFKLYSKLMSALEILSFMFKTLYELRFMSLRFIQRCLL